MTASTCRYDRDNKTHLTREHLAECADPTCRGCRPCTHEEGSPVRHCRTRLRCTSHLGWTEQTCPTCLGKVRTNLTRILTAMALMPAEVEEAGNLRTAAAGYVPGATAHPGAWRARRLYNVKTGGYVEDHDELDPWQMLGLRERMIREDLGHDHRLVSNTLAETCGYIAWVLTDLARDEEQTVVIAELMSETARLADHLESVLHDSRKPERGAPCRSCPERFDPETGESKGRPRLHLKPGHWCESEGCTREHHADDTGDLWVCPADRDHWWTAADYRRWVYADAREAASS